MEATNKQKKQKKQNVPAGTKHKHEKPRFVEWTEFIHACAATADDLERFDAQIARIEKHSRHAAQIYFAATAISVIALALAGLAVIAATGVIQ